MNLRVLSFSFVFLAACGVKAGGDHPTPVPELSLVRAAATRDAADHVEGTLTITNHGVATDAARPLCAHAEWLDVDGNLIEVQDRCVAAPLAKDETATITMRSFGTLHGVGGHFIVSLAYAGAAKIDAESLLVAVPS